MQVLQAVRRISRAAHAEGCPNNVGVTAGKVIHNASNARGVTAGEMGSSSSLI